MFYNYNACIANDARVEAVCFLKINIRLKPYTGIFVLVIFCTRLIQKYLICQYLR